MHGRLSWLFMVLAFVMVAGFAWLFWPHSQPQVAVVFLGYTNQVDGSSAARFAVTNRSRHTVLRSRVYQVEGQGSTPSNRIINYYALPIPSNALGVALRAGEGEVVTIPERNLRGNWRVNFTFFPETMRSRLAAKIQGPVGTFLRRVVPQRWRGVRTRNFSSEWLGYRTPDAGLTNQPSR